MKLLLEGELEAELEIDGDIEYPLPACKLFGFPRFLPFRILRGITVEPKWHFPSQIQQDISQWHSNKHSVCTWIFYARQLHFLYSRIKRHWKPAQFNFF